MCPRPYAFETPSKTKKPKQTNEVARDTKLRKEFYKSAMSQFNLLKMIGITQMETKFLRNKSLSDRSKTMEKYEYQQSEQEEVKEIIHDVLVELQSKENQLSNDSLR